MISNGQMVGLILAIVVPIMIGIVVFLHIKKELKVKGLFFTACYGAVGYLWEAWIYAMAYNWLSAWMIQEPWFLSGIGDVVRQILVSLLYAVFVAGGLYWAVFLANMRESDTRRGTTVGLGFGICYTVWNYCLVYGAPLIYGFQMKFGIFDESEEIKQKVLGLPVENMYLFALDTVLFSLILIGTTLVMGYYHQHGKKGRMFIVVFVSQFFIKFFNTLFPTLLPDMVSTVLYHCLMSALAIYSMWILLTYLKTGRVLLKKDTDIPLGSKKTEKDAESSANFTYAGNKKRRP